MFLRQSKVSRICLICLMRSYGCLLIKYDSLYQDMRVYNHGIGCVKKDLVLNILCIQDREESNMVYIVVLVIVDYVYV